MKTRNPVLYVEQERLRALGEAVEEADRVEPSRTESGLAGLAHVTEGLASICLRVPEGLQSAWRHSLDALRTNAELDFEAEWRDLSQGFEQGQRVLRRTLESVRHYAALGCRIEGLAEVEAALREVREMHLEAFKTWPPDPKKIAAAQADFAAGKGCRPDDAFAEAAGVSKDEWVRRVEAHKAAREQR